ncbi:hypothetical protein N0V84_000794 [Fusarium piperis]|uniref:Uncharacterized protein n=1 Tax=Fusarium piperis TaxID=1435070 RepID=A0A9W9BTP6_9HYPO|nr:hypothetical protein N0V84_000794 [Fusarium piperis]
MRHFTFLSVLLSFGAFAAGVTAALPGVVSNATTNSQGKISMTGRAAQELNSKYFMRPDGTEIEPQDFICETYSLLGKIEESFRSNPPYLADIFFSESFEKKINDIDEKCMEDFSGNEEKCVASLAVLSYIGMSLGVQYIAVVYQQQCIDSKEPIQKALTKPEMCGEGWKHGQTYVVMREDMKEELLRKILEGA